MKCKWENSQNKRLKTNLRYDIAQQTLQLKPGINAFSPKKRLIKALGIVRSDRTEFSFELGFKRYVPLGNLLDRT